MVVMAVMMMSAMATMVMAVVVTVFVIMAVMVIVMMIVAVMVIVPKMVMMMPVMTTMAVVVTVFVIMAVMVIVMVIVPKMVMMILSVMTGVSRRNFVGGFADGSAGGSAGGHCQGLTQTFVDASHGLGGFGDGRGQSGIIADRLPFAVFFGVAFIVINPMFEQKTNLFSLFHGDSCGCGDICPRLKPLQANRVRQEIDRAQDGRRQILLAIEEGFQRNVIAVGAQLGDIFHDQLFAIILTENNTEITHNSSLQ